MNVKSETEHMMKRLLRVKLDWTADAIYTLTSQISYITLHYSDKCFQGKNFNHFTRVKRNRKDEFSVDVWKQVVMWQIWFL